MSDAHFLLETALLYGALPGTLLFNLRTRRMVGLVSHRRVKSRVMVSTFGLIALAACFILRIS